MATWTEKQKMYMTAHLIYHETGATALPCSADMVQAQKNGSNAFQTWAIDVRSCAGGEHALRHLDDYYLRPSSGYCRVPAHLKPILRLFWKNMRQRRLIRQGEWIVNAIYEDGYIFS